MNQETAEKLAGSLTFAGTEILPFLPYLLQDLWELGSDPVQMARLIGKHIDLSQDTKILDLACGKGAVSVEIAQRLHVRVKGIDIMPEFIEYAVKKAQEAHVRELCHFVVGDINEAVIQEKDYDCVILGAVGKDVLDGAKETLRKLKATLKPGGYILMDDTYLSDIQKQENVKYKNYEHVTKNEWLALFEELEVTLIKIIPNEETPDYSSEMAVIEVRAHELIRQYPEKREMFEDYVRSQWNECDDLENNVTSAVFMLKKT